MVAAVGLGRPDLLVLALPLAIVALWSVLVRPREIPEASVGLGSRSVREGEPSTWSVSLTLVPGLEDVIGRLEPSPFIDLSPASGVAMASADDPARRDRDTLAVRLSWRSTRWGVRPVGPSLVGATSAWSAFCFGPLEFEPASVSTVPAPAVFDAASPTPHPQGLVGLHRSARPGDGSEFAGIREFQPGDRLRRIHWPVSSRTGKLHVTSTYADEDTEVLLLIDAFNDLGPTGGIAGAASSLDVSVRAAAAVAEHYLRQGDRVGLRVIGAADVTRVPPRGGHRQLRRILDTLATIAPGTDRYEQSTRAGYGVGAQSLVVALSPLVSTSALRQVVTLARRGLTVVVVDTLPPNLGAPTDEPAMALAWRIRMLERAGEIARVSESGIPVVPWRGPGSLDVVLRQLGRRGSAARMGRR